MANCVKRLAAFDFDNTIIVDNSDTVVRDLLSKDVIPRYLRDGWTSYMQNIFNCLHRCNIGETIIKKTIISIKPIDGMCELIKTLSENFNYDIIIISDSNSYFINSWLAEYKLMPYIKHVFTNPATFDNGLLKIEKYHEQNWCTLSEVNLCKGHVLEDFIKSQAKAGCEYKQVIYMGDGSNDFCPMLRLNHEDIAFCREGYPVADLIDAARSKKLVKKQVYDVKAKFYTWKCGWDILNIVKATV